MHENQYIKLGKKNSRMFEFLIVLIVIAFSIYSGINYYSEPGDEAPEHVAEVHAGIFLRMISNIHALGKVDQNNFVVINGTYFYLNEKGWPANADGGKSPSLRNQTAEECQQLWKSIFTNPPSSEIAGRTYKKKNDYRISLNKKVICRYQLVGKQESSYSLDYDVSNGVVTVFRP